MTLSMQMAKFKFRQYQLRAVSPNLMLAKITRYTVHIKREPITKEILNYNTNPLLPLQSVHQQFQ